LTPPEPWHSVYPYQRRPRSGNLHPSNYLHRKSVDSYNYLYDLKITPWLSQRNPGTSAGRGFGAGCRTSIRAPLRRLKLQRRRIRRRRSLARKRDRSTLLIPKGMHARPSISYGPPRWPKYIRKKTFHSCNTREESEIRKGFSARPTSKMVFPLGA
jgi:hypothetical protein